MGREVRRCWSRAAIRSMWHEEDMSMDPVLDTYMYVLTYLGGYITKV